MYGRYRKGGSCQVTVSGEIMGAPFEQSVTLDLPALDESNPEIERMWASHRVDRLLREIRSGATPQSATADVVSLCENYSIVSEYASFIVLENDAEYQRWKIARRNASRVNRDRRAQTAVQQQLQQLRDASLAKLGPETDSAPQLTSASQPNRPQQSPSSAAAPSRPVSRGRNFDFAPTAGGGGGGSRGGGGAFDPLSAVFVCSMAGAGVALDRRRRRQRQQH